MKKKRINWLNIFRQKKALAKANQATRETSADAIQAELFSVDQMERHGQRLARSHKLTTHKTPYYLLQRLNDNERVLVNSCQTLSQCNKANMTPAGNWLLDNFYIIEEQIRAVRQHLPKNFGRGLPQLAPPHGCPRIYDIATEAIAHGDGRWDAENLARYIAAYQKETSLKLGELWALPGMLRLALLENLRRVAVEVAQIQQERNLADSWVTKMQEAAANDPANLIVVIADMARSNPPRTSAFVAELVRRLQGHGTMLALPLTWVEQRLTEVKLTSSELVHRFNQQLAANQLSVSNSITGLRQLSEMDWPEFVETLSQVERILQKDPTGIYGRMHFNTRDRYRHVIEMLARHCPYSEIEIARQTLDMAQQAAQTPDAPQRSAHVGYYLIAQGRKALEQRLGVKLGVVTRVRHAFSQMPLLAWLGSLSLLTTASCAELLSQGHAAGISYLWLLLLAVPLVIVFSQLFLNALGNITGHSRAPQSLPRLDFSAGIPAECRTLIAVPTLLSSKSTIDQLINTLEVCYLGNDMAHLHFALLTDFTDAPQQQRADDDVLLNYAVHHIESLNARYPGQAASHFFLFNRSRQWNDMQQVWMGYERKRGKLNALNDWLRNRGNVFSTQIGFGLEVLKNVKYVITLDSDTVLPRDTAHQLIAAMAHPLNQPRYDEASRRVVDGYAILQPRMAEEIPRYGQSRYAALSSATPGNDPYTLASSDIYQDLFGEGSFIGKGIYDVDVYARALRDVCPDNVILSHDLLEGCYARAGLISDVLLYEQYPSSYLVDVVRRTRWIRGDWQLLHWLRPSIKTASGTYVKNRLSMLSRWKLFDNLRRSLVAPSLMALLFFSAVWLPVNGYWLMAFLLPPLLPALLSLLQDGLHKPPYRPLARHLWLTVRGIGSNLRQLGLTLAVLPHQAWYSLRAIAITLWRMGVSKHNLQEWASYAHSINLNRITAANFYRVMWANPLAAALLLLAGVLYHGPLLALILPLALLWALAPLLFCLLSRPPLRPAIPLSLAQRTVLRQLSRETWDFFATFVTADENWLPPDNVQEMPATKIAHRTSPTNIGLALLADLTAYDFGYLTLAAAIQRIERTLATVSGLEHYRGHLYNWYDTRTLAPLSPRYISSVDSGNLAGHLLTLRAGLPALREQPAIDPQRMLNGLSDTLGLLEQHWGSSAPKALPALRQRLAVALQTPPGSLMALLEAMRHDGAELKKAAQEQPAAIHHWANALDHELQALCQAWPQWYSWLDGEDTHQEPLPSLAWLAAPPQGLKLSVERQAYLIQAGMLAKSCLQRLAALEQKLAQMAQMDFGFLYNQATHLLTIGFNCEQNRPDSGKYDLLASEIRLTNYVAIATNQIPQRSWYALGRLFTVLDRQPALMSWSGSMFEYLMPQLVMPAYPGSLLAQMCRTAVQWHIDWGKKNRVPWGVSESGYFGFDAQQNYQYHAFGVPGLGLRRGLSDDMVVAPYATVMALMVDARRAYRNLVTLESHGARGRYGFYEALDYTPSRLSHGQSFVVVRSYMAHHQGMSLLAFSNLLLDAPMVDRFASSPVFQSARLLLQERVPDAIELYGNRRQFEANDGLREPASVSAREFTHLDSLIPEVQLLANANYRLMLTQTGGSYRYWQNLSLTRWREDATCDNWGAFCYLKDPQTGETWSNTWQPLGGVSQGDYAVFNDAGAKFQRTLGTLAVKTQVVVSPEDDIELRRVTLVNHGKQPRLIEVTSYAEVVLAPANNDLAHPAFSNLFVQTELLAEQDAILCHRRPREPHEQSPWLLHMMTVQQPRGGVSFETDRAKFIGRGRTAANPQALQQNGPLSNSAGAVLDPVIAIRQRVLLEPNIPVTLDIFYGVSESRAGGLGMLEKYRDRHLADRVFELAWSHSQVVLRQLNINEDEANLYNRLAGAVIFPGPEMRAAQSDISRNRRGQSGLWGHAISGDLPIVLLTVTNSENIALVQQLIQAHSYWQIKGLQVDLVIINETAGGYRQDLQNDIMALISAGVATAHAQRAGGIFVRSSEHLAAEDRTLLLSVARIYLDDRQGELAAQLQQRLQVSPAQQRSLALISASTRLPTVAPLPQELPRPPLPAVGNLQFYNGTGGFSPDGREYIITLGANSATPMPWANVIANPGFGSVVSESGQSYTWFENAHEYRLTPWNNDPVSDSSGEAFYLRDEENGHVWSPTALPARGNGGYLTRHGFGYSVFEHRENGIDSQLTVFVAKAAPVKLFLLTLTNLSGRTRKLSATGYMEFILGDLRQNSAMHIATRGADARNGCGILATNHYGGNGNERTAFFGVSGAHCSITGDRREFIGRNGTLAKPEALTRRRLSGNTGAGLDPCGAAQSAMALIDGDQRSVVFALGIGSNADQAEALLRQYLQEDVLLSALEQVKTSWRDILGKVQIHTPQPQVDLLANGWLLYQTLSCRIYARSGYYQSGGAFGFRDQLQDILALSHVLPQRMREQIVLCASHQFIEGDVLHWWHPPQGNGVRTRCSDDYLWLPLAVCHYLDATGDDGILAESIPYLEARQVPPGEESTYEQPQQSAVKETLYQHAARALRHGLRFGEHGLPLMGSGDWNDGMNRVGLEGRGESVWLGFFLFHILQRFGALATRRNDGDLAALCRWQADQLRQHLADHAWDGTWYRRGYFDDGTALGSQHSAECRIDAIAQSWAVLSGAGDTARNAVAMQALDEHLVDENAGLIKLLTPPFNGDGPDPGYIRGYLPGVRENGGQYTHGAIWAVMAFAEMGNVERAWELLDLINPIVHSQDKSAVARYKVEPYVISADVYSEPPHTGRGGWSWYTGSAGWLYRLILESLLGLKRQGDMLAIETRLPAHWPQVTVSYREGGSEYHITLVQGSGKGQISVDGVPQPGLAFRLVDDGNPHQVAVMLAKVDG